MLRHRDKQEIIYRAILELVPGSQHLPLTDVYLLSCAEGHVIIHAIPEALDVIPDRRVQGNSVASQSLPHKNSNNVGSQKITPDI